MKNNALFVSSIVLASLSAAGAGVLAGMLIARAREKGSYLKAGREMWHDFSEHMPSMKEGKKRLARFHSRFPMPSR